MKIVITFAKRGSDGREVYRQAVVACTLRRVEDMWMAMVARALHSRQTGERVVSISEGGYH